MLFAPLLTGASADARTVFGGVIGPTHDPFGLELDVRPGASVNSNYRARWDVWRVWATRAGQRPGWSRAASGCACPLAWHARLRLGGQRAGLRQGADHVAIAVAGVSRGLTGFPLVVPLVVPLELTGGPAAGAAILGLLAAAVTTRLALRASPAEAMRGKE